MLQCLFLLVFRCKRFFAYFEGKNMYQRSNVSIRYESIKKTFIKSITNTL